MGSQPSLACAAVFLAKLPAGILSPHQLLRSTRAASSASGAEGSGAAGITQQSIPQVCLSILQHLHRPFCPSLSHIL